MACVAWSTLYKLLVEVPHATKKGKVAAKRGRHFAKTESPVGIKRRGCTTQILQCSLIQSSRERASSFSHALPCAIGAGNIVDAKPGGGEGVVENSPGRQKAYNTVTELPNQRGIRHWYSSPGLCERGCAEFGPTREQSSVNSPTRAGSITSMPVITMRASAPSARCMERSDMIRSRPCGARPSMDWDDYFRQQAAMYRRLAEKTEDVFIKQELIDLAAVCEEVANNIEDRRTSG